VTRETVIRRGRVAAEKGMTDTCKVERRTGISTSVVNGVTVTTKFTIYTGKCRVRPWSSLGKSIDQPRTIAGQFERLVRIGVQLPLAGTDDLRDADIITILTSAHDVDLVGRTFAVRDPAIKSDATQRFVGCTEVL